MANPPDLLVFKRRLPPKGQREYYPVLTQGDDTDDFMLQTGEEVTAFDVVLSAEAIAAGLRLLEGDDSPRYESLVFVFWVDIDPARRGDATFEGKGVTLRVEIYYETSFGRHDSFSVGVLAVIL